MKFLIIIIMTLTITLKLCFAECSSPIDFINTGTMVILGITLIVLLDYTKATQDIAKATRETNEFSTSSLIHEKLSTRESHLMRWYLHEHFERDFASAVKHCFGDEYVLGQGEEISVNISNVLTKWESKLNDKTNEFRRRLKENNNIRQYIKDENLHIESPFELVERILLDFDFIAIPFCNERMEAIKPVAKMYKAVFERTAPKILPFIAVQRKLRDENYKNHYIFLLSELGIDTQGLRVPTKKEFAA